MKLNAVAALGALMCAVGCGSVSQGDVESEPAGVIDSEITRGDAQNTALYNKYGLVAVYHKVNGSWAPRPCSGKVLSSVNGESIVLTAGHCIAADGSIGGGINSSDGIKLLATRVPGIANPNPPAAAVSPHSISIQSFISQVGLSPSYEDLGLLKVTADWSAQVVSRQGLYVGPTEHLLGQTTYAYGYGISTDMPNDGCDATPSFTTGAGTARRGGPFTIDSVKSTLSPNNQGFTFLTQAGGQAPACGDEGGPDVTTFGSGAFHWGIQVGLQSSPWESAMPNEFLYAELGGVPLSPFSDPTVDLTLSGNAVVRGSAANFKRFWYFPNELHVRIGFAPHTCLSIDSAQRPIQATCSTATVQLWLMTPSQQIVHRNTGLCLTHNGARPILEACIADDPANSRWFDQLWAFHPQP